MVPAGRDGHNPEPGAGAVAIGATGPNREAGPVVRIAGTRATGTSSNGWKSHGLRNLTGLRGRRRMQRPAGMTATARAGRGPGGANRVAAASLRFV
jgi:hypothetical protein